MKSLIAAIAMLLGAGAVLLGWQAPHCRINLHWTERTGGGRAGS